MHENFVRRVLRLVELLDDIVDVLRARHSADVPFRVKYCSKLTVTAELTKSEKMNAAQLSGTARYRCGALHVPTI